MKHRTGICSLLLALVLLFGLLPQFALPAWADDPHTGTCGENLSWRFDPDSGTLSIEGSGAMTDYVQMGPWEDYAAAIKRVVFPAGITSIGGCAFAGCTGLTELSLPEGVRIVAWGAFKACTELTSVMLPASLTDLSSDAFIRCTKLTAFQIAADNPVYSVDACGVLLNKNQTRLIAYPCGRRGGYAIPAAVVSIEYGAFEGCAALTEIRFPEGLTRIGEEAFYDCTGLTALSFPDSLKSIDRFAFYGCSGLKEISLQVGLSSIGQSAFYNCSGLRKLIFPLGLSSIGDWAFRGCGGLTELAFQEGLSSIGSGAFEDCPNLSRVALPKSLSSLGEKAFAYCWDADAYYFEKLASFTVCGYENTLAQRYAEDSGLRFVALDGQQPQGFCGRDLRWSFDGESGALRVEGSGSMWNFKNEAPWHEFCSQIKTVSLPKGLSAIGAFAFADCAGLGEIVFPASLTAIGQGAFTGCSGLDSVRFPAGLNAVAPDAFAACSGLKAFHIAADNAAYSSDACGVWLNQDQSSLIAYPCGRSGSYVVPATVTAIGRKAFYACGGLTELTLPAGLSSIEAEGISGCSALRSLIVRSDHAYLSAPRQSGENPGEAGSYWTDGLLGPSDQLAVFGYQNSAMPNRRNAEDPEQYWFYLPHYARNLLYRFYELGAFSDVGEGRFYELPVAWAKGEGITNGTDKTHFSPGDTCTRGQVVTQLWRANGKTPTGCTTPFVDAVAGAYYYDAMGWAVQTGVTKGIDATHFAPNEPCTRAQVVTFLWRAAGSPTPEQTENPFVDVPEGTFYSEAVLWAVEKGITKGTDDTRFSPHESCTRGQVVTFLYRAN